MKTWSAFKSLGRIGIMATSLFLAGCSGDDDNGGGGDTPSGFHVNAKINGVSYGNSEYFEPTAVIASNTLMIQSSDNSGNSIQIQISNYDGPGTYESGNNNVLNGYINYLDMGETVGQYTSYTSVRGDGVVEITEVSDTEVRGTFSATAYENVENATNSVEITEGTFRAEIQ
ncbi:MAG TPA: hypothetical protein VF581_00315 [Flavobacterium sp.]|jgi:hypothetical protein